MKNVRSLLYFSAVVVWMLIPAIVLAQGLVPCGLTEGLTPGTPEYVKAATSCQACNLAQLIQNVINYAIGFAIAIAALLFAWAGVVYFTAGGDPGKYNQAQRIFKHVFLGFVLALTAWLIVQTILFAIFKDSFYGGWNKIQCVNDDKRNRTASIGDLLKPLAGLTVVPLPPKTYDTQDAWTGCIEGDLLSSGQCYDPYNPDGSSYAPKSKGSPLGGSPGLGNTTQYSAELAGVCAQVGFNDCALAQAVMAVESSGKANAISPAGCVGLMQVCPATALGLDPSLAGLSNAQITQKLQNPTYNMTLGVQYLSQLQTQFGPTENMIAAYNGGPKANTSSKTCPGQTYWQCSANAGYTETRNYVPKVLATKGLI